MRLLILPTPPDPARYRNAMELARAQFDWMTRVKSVIEQTAKVNWAPATPTILATNFTTNTVVTGTTTGTDLANVVATLVQILTNKGITSTISGTTPP